MQYIEVKDLAQLEWWQEETAVRTYQDAFALYPYLELFTYDQALAALEYILKKDGDLLIGQTDDEQVISLAGGYMQNDTYFIEELAVTPNRQGEGIGRETLSNLLDLGSKRDPTTFEIRTTITNTRALSLYKNTFGFSESGQNIVVPQRRQDGQISLDERMYLRKLLKEKPMSEEKNVLKRAVIAYPGGNTTALVFDQLQNTYRFKEEREALNNRVSNAWLKLTEDKMPEIEQCCFITLPKNKKAIARVEMFGGEFCGNATRSAIQVLTGGSDYQGSIEVSGVDNPLEFSVKDGVISVEMPIPQKDLVTKVAEGYLVTLKGISQLVVINPVSTQTARVLLDDLIAKNKYMLADQPAVGVTYYDEKSGNAQFCVWVNKINTKFDETACGSGTCAIGIAKSFQKKSNSNLTVIQPSRETINTRTFWENGKVTSSSISGKVDILYDGEISI